MERFLAQRLHRSIPLRCHSSASHWRGTGQLGTSAAAAAHSACCEVTVFELLLGGMRNEWWTASLTGHLDLDHNGISENAALSD